MNLHQFRFVQEAVRRNLNLTEVAKVLHTSQPGVSKAILELEGELGIEIFGRHGKRLKRVTEPGEHVLKSIDIILREVSNLKRIGEQYSAQDSGTLSIATTHTQARYVLPLPVAQLRSAYPLVALEPCAPGETAQRWAYADSHGHADPQAGEIGVISSVTQAFCGDCNRARLSTEGQLYLCLFAHQGYDLRSIVRASEEDGALQQAITSIWQARSDRYSLLRATQAADSSPQGARRVEMSYIGG